MKIVTDNMDCTIINKNMKNGVSLEIDNSNNIYVAKRTQIKLITPEGKEKNVISNGNYDIEDILYNDNKLYFISKTTLYKLDLENLDIEDYLENIPLSGNNVDRKLFLVNGNMGLAIGACTNSGVSEGNILNSKSNVLVTSLATLEFSSKFIFSRFFMKFFLLASTSNSRPLSSSIIFIISFSMSSVAFLTSTFISFDIFSNSFVNLSSLKSIATFICIFPPSIDFNDLNTFSIMLPFLLMSYAFSTVLDKS